MQKHYCNPIAKTGDFADPFVLRYNGRYYLYATNPDLRCWSSDNLLDWHLEGPAIKADTFPGLVPFAPEVVYDNGCFYMYTSPSGHGHYVLKSELPTGPFEKITGNVGHAIDGSVFIDDDGQWYFYWAGDEGIWGCKMASPTTFGEPVLTGATLHGWTEGPMVVKRDGLYFMTYTGNHYLSMGYRIQTAWSKDPLRGYTDDPYNPAVIHTQGEVAGLGHSSTVQGPDLVSSYMVYHNIKPDASRELDIDRQLWHGRATCILGPTRTPQPAPPMPQYSTLPLERATLLEWNVVKGNGRQSGAWYTGRPGGFEMLSRQTMPPRFTAEFNLKATGWHDGGAYGVLLADNGAARQICFGFLPDGEVARLYTVHDGTTTLLCETKLPAGFSYDALHCVRLEADGRSLRIYVDGRTQLAGEVHCAGAVCIGYFSDNAAVSAGYTAATGMLACDVPKQCLKPVPGAFGAAFGRGDGTADSEAAVCMRQGQQMAYSLLAAKQKAYVLALFAGASQPAEIALSIHGKKMLLDCAAAPMEVLKAHIDLPEGEHSLHVECIRGECVLRRIEVYEAGAPDAELLTALAVDSVGKMLGQQDYDDFTLNAQLNIQPQDGGKGGLLLRVTEPAEGGEEDDRVLGVHFFIGYSLAFDGERLILARHRYDETVLAQCAAPYLSDDGKMDLRVVAKGPLFQVWLNGESTPCLHYVDERPILHGVAGIWAKGAQVQGGVIEVIPEKTQNGEWQ